MIEASVNWTDSERYVGAAASRHSIVIDTAKEKTANSPMELVLLGLCGCTASDVVGILRKKRERFTGLEVRAAAERADGARLGRAGDGRGPVGGRRGAVRAHSGRRLTPAESLSQPPLDLSCGAL